MLILLTLFYGWSCDHVSGIDGKSRLALPLLSEAIYLPLNPGECGIFNAGMIPNIKENPRNRKTTKRGRKRFFNAAIHALRMRVEPTFTWEDKFKRLLLRFEHIQQRLYGMKLMAYTLMNLREFCGT